MALAKFPSSTVVSWEASNANALPWGWVADEWLAAATRKAGFMRSVMAFGIDKWRRSMPGGWSACDGAIAGMRALEGRGLHRARCRVPVRAACVLTHQQRCEPPNRVCIPPQPLPSLWRCGQTSCGNQRCVIPRGVGTLRLALQRHRAIASGVWPIVRAWRRTVTSSCRRHPPVQDVYCDVELRGTLTRGMSVFDW